MATPKPALDLSDASEAELEFLQLCRGLFRSIDLGDEPAFPKLAVNLVADLVKTRQRFDPADKTVYKTDALKAWLKEHDA